MKKKYILIIVILFSLIITSIMVSFMIETGIDYVRVLIVDEQNDHYYKMQESIKDLKDAQREMQVYMEILDKKQFTQDQRDELATQLRNMEEIAMNISRRTGFYQEDTTVHLFFDPDYRILQYFDNARNTPLYINRFVRAMEKGIFEQYMTKIQKENIQNNFELLQKEIETL